jgi:hypothetical protein
MTYANRYIPADDLIEQLRKAGSVWFRNDDLLLLEELIRRFKVLRANQKGDSHGQQQQST